MSETGVAHVEEKIADEFGLSQNEREKLLPSDRQRLLHNRIHWAKFYLLKAGLMSSPKRGRFINSDRGKDFLKKRHERIDITALRNYLSFLEFYNRKKKDIIIETQERRMI